MPTHHYDIRVTGKVQGVCFRDETQRFAREHGIVGKVLNEPDGSVYLEAEGEPENLEALFEWLETGPEAAEVEEVKKARSDPRGYDNFTVERPARGYS